MSAAAIKFVLWSLLLLGCWRAYRSITKISTKPELEQDPWWGLGDPIVRPQNSKIEPFVIDIPQEDLDDLKTRLSLPLRLSPPLQDANFTYGFNSDILKVVHHYWVSKYDWRQREERLNRFRHFKTQIEGLDIHFIHAKPNPKDLGVDTQVIPLLISHGWPGSFVEFDEIIPMLTTPWGGKGKGKIAFEVIAPSLPGYGFSQASAKQGLNAFQTGQIFLKLMKRLKFEKFYVQGGDWGSLISSSMATLYPEHVLGIHLNMFGLFTPTNSLKHILGSFMPAGLIMDPQDEIQMYPLGDFFGFLLRETGYFHLQATKPDTIGSVLNNSPIGLAAYILEKFSSWTHKQNTFKRDGGLLSKEFPISMDRMLDNICVYWFTNSITSSQRFYKETIQKAFEYKLDEIPCTVPAGLAAFPHDLANSPEAFVKSKYTDLVSYNRMPVGGHFAAMEQPRLLAEDIHSFVATVEGRTKTTNKEEL